jgi:hypothetical protein
MTTVPLTRRNILISAVVVATAGASITLAHQLSAGSSSEPTLHNTGSIEVTPSLSSRGVVENPPAEVKIDGQSVSVPQSGTATVATPSGTATVRVSGDQTTVTRQESVPSHGGSGSSLNISVQSSSNGNDNADNRVRYRSSTESESSSNSSVKIKQKGEGTVSVPSP